MYERQARPRTAASASVFAGIRAIGRRLRGRGETIQMLPAYAMIVTAIITLIVSPPAGPAWRFYLTLAALVTLLIVNQIGDGIKQERRARRAALIFLGLSTLLIFTAIWFGLGGTTFLPFLLFMLVSQAVLLLPLSAALAMAAALLAGWIGLLWLKGGDPYDLNNLTLVGLGMIFSIVFSLANLRAIQERRRAEGLLHELRSVNAELTAAREREKELAAADERMRVARDIHDGLGHHLTVLNVQLQAAAKLIERDPGRAAAALAICREEAHAALDEVRQSVAALRRSPLDGRSLDEALALLIGDFERRSGVQARYQIQGAAVPLTPVATTTLFRAAQEGLTNAQKHAQAQAVAVTLSFDPTNVRLSVRDDGAPAAQPGFSAAVSAPVSGFGLAGLRERAQQLGGGLQAGPVATGGFLLELSMPIERNRDDSDRAGG
jgi:signal transduction histidine kinase